MSDTSDQGASAFEPVWQLFMRALDLPAAEREAFVRREAGERTELADQLLGMLRDASGQGPSTGSLLPQDARQRLFRAVHDDDMVLARVAHFRIEQVLGVGGMGAVFLAHDEHLDRPVALKLVRRDLLDDRLDQRFEREVRATARLDHPNICHVYETGLSDGRRYMAMQWIDGVTLEDRLDAQRHAAEFGPAMLHLLCPADATVPGSAGSDASKHGGRRPGSGSSRRELEAVLLLLERVARALHVAHESGLVHRDLKPGNIMITGNGEPVILDFGLARDIDADGPSLSSTGAAIGTPMYMAPEQVRPEPGRRLDRRTDIHALGAILFECLTLRSAYEGQSAPELFDSIRNSPVPRADRLNSGVPFELQVVLERALAKRVEDRYPDALALAEDLRRVRCYEPIQARRAGVWLRAWRWSQRQPAAALALLSLAAGLATASVLGWRLSGQNVELTRALTERKTAQDAQQRTAADAAWRAAQGAIERGSWAEVDRYVATARANGFEDDVELQLLELEACDSSFQPERVREILQALAARDDLGEHHADVLLWRGTLDSEDDPAYLRFVEQALELHRSGACRFSGAASEEFALAWLSEDLQDAGRHLEAAIAADPRHLPSHSALGVVLALVGRVDDALAFCDRFEAVAPDARNDAWLLRVWMLASKGEFEAARSMSEAMDDDEFRCLFAVALVDTFELLDSMMTHVGKTSLCGPMGMLPPDPGLLARVRERANILGLVTRFGAAVSRLGASPTRLRILPVVRRLFDPIRQLFGKLLLLDATSLAGPLEQISVSLPDPVLLLMMTIPVTVEESASAEQHERMYQRDRELLARAAAGRGPTALLPGARRAVALRRMAVHWTWNFWAPKANLPDYDAQAVHLEFDELVRAALGVIDDDEDVLNALASAASQFASETNKVALVGTVFLRWRELHPESVRRCRITAQWAAGRQDLGLQRQTLDEWLRIEPDSEDARAQLEALDGR